MLINIFFYVVGYILDLIGSNAPSWIIWPHFVTDGLVYIAGKFADFNILFPVDTVFSNVIFMMNFILSIAAIKLIMLIVNRGKKL